MEKQGLVQCVEFLHSRGFSIDKLVTDRHRQIGKWLREELPNTQHVYDVWHVAKGETEDILIVDVIHIQLLQ